MHWHKLIPMKILSHSSSKSERLKRQNTLQQKNEENYLRLYHSYSTMTAKERGDAWKMCFSMRILELKKANDALVQNNDTKIKKFFKKWNLYDEGALRLMYVMRLFLILIYRCHLNHLKKSQYHKYSSTAILTPSTIPIRFAAISWMQRKWLNFAIKWSAQFYPTMQPSEKIFLFGWRTFKKIM